MVFIPVPLTRLLLQRHDLDVLFQVWVCDTPTYILVLLMQFNSCKVGFVKLHSLVALNIKVIQFGLFVQQVASFVPFVIKCIIFINLF